MKSISLAIAAAAMLCTTAVHAQTAGCSVGGPGGIIPTSGSGGGGAYPNTLPPFETSSVLTVASLPGGATAVTEVKLNGLTHTWAGDLMFVLESPGGVKVNLLTRQGGNCQLAGDYVIVSPDASQPFPGCSGGFLPPSSFSQVYGDWPTGTNGIDNANISSLAPQLGNWMLTIYDWAGGDIGDLVSWDLCFGTPPSPPPPPPPVVCVPGGAGGLIPTSGTGGGGLYPGTLPPAELVAPLNVASVPPGSIAVGAVKLNGLFHTYADDLSFVLTDPLGSQYMLLNRTGGSCDFNGDYTIVPFEQGAAFPVCSAGSLPPATFSQSYGGWAGGTHGIGTTSLSAIAPQVGVWTLTVYDWFNLDSGSLNDWELCFVGGSSGPVNYCTAKVTSSGCVPAIGFSGTPSAAGNYVLTCTQVEASQLGVLFWGVNGQASIVFQGGYLCVAPPVVRLPFQGSGGAGACTGTYSQQFTSVISQFSPGQTLNSQFWFRDPGAASGTGLSDANECVVQ